MFRKITVTEDNYLHILKKIQKTTDRWKVLEKYQVFKGDLKHEEKKYRRFSIGISKNGKYNKKDDTYTVIRKLYKHHTFIKAAEHSFKIEFDKDPDSFNGKMYEKMSSLIHLNTSASCANVMGIGDMIMFLPLGSFIVYTDDSYTHYNKEEPLSIYKHTYIPDFFGGKIYDLTMEESKREQEWAEEVEWWNEQYCRELEEDFDY